MLQNSECQEFIDAFKRLGDDPTKLMGDLEYVGGSNDVPVLSGSTLFFKPACIHAGQGKHTNLPRPGGDHDDRRLVIYDFLPFKEYNNDELIVDDFQIHPMVYAMMGCPDDRVKKSIFQKWTEYLDGNKETFNYYVSNYASYEDYFQGEDADLDESNE